MPFCPGCGAEYKHGSTECSDCELLLQNWKPVPRPSPPGVLATWFSTGALTGVSIGALLVLVLALAMAVSQQPLRIETFFRAMALVPMGVLVGAVLGAVGGAVMGLTARFIEARANRILIAMLVGGAITGLPFSSVNIGVAAVAGIPGAVAGLIAGLVAERRLRATRR